MGSLDKRNLLATWVWDKRFYLSTITFMHCWPYENCLMEREKIIIHFFFSFCHFLFLSHIHHCFTNISLSLSFLYAFLFLVFSCSIFCLFLYSILFYTFHLFPYFIAWFFIPFTFDIVSRQLVIKLLTQTKKMFLKKIATTDWRLKIEKVQNKMSDKIKNSHVQVKLNLWCSLAEFFYLSW